MKSLTHRQRALMVVAGFFKHSLLAVPATAIIWLRVRRSGPGPPDRQSGPPRKALLSCQPIKAMYPIVNTTTIHLSSDWPSVGPSAGKLNRDSRNIDRVLLEAGQRIAVLLGRAAGSAENSELAPLPYQPSAFITAAVVGAASMIESGRAKTISARSGSLRP